MLASIILVATMGCTRAQAALVFGASGATAHRWFMEWSKVWVRAKLYRPVLDELGARGDLDWSRCPGPRRGWSSPAHSTAARNRHGTSSSTRLA